MNQEVGLLTFNAGSSREEVDDSLLYFQVEDIRFQGKLQCLVFRTP